MSSTLKLLLLLACSPSFITCDFPLMFTDKQLEEARNGGVPYINQAKREDNSKAKDVYNKFKETNESCQAKSKQAANLCRECVLAACGDRVRGQCPPTYPHIEPTCNSIKSNASYSCLYYANKQFCHSCSDLKSPACIKCVRDHCVQRAVAVCPKKPSTEPSCVDLRSNSSFYCMYYSDHCNNCTTPSQCTQCVADRCSLVFEEKCPIQRPTTIPSCKDIIDDAAYSCKYYMSPRYCLPCRNLSRFEQCKKCADDSCDKRSKESCSWLQKLLYKKALSDITSEAADCPMKVIFEELLLYAAELAVEEIIPIEPLGALLIEGVGLMLHMGDLMDEIVRLFHTPLKDIPGAVVRGFECFVTSTLPDLVEKMANEVIETVKWVYHDIVKVVNTIVGFFENFFNKRKRRNLIGAIENMDQPSCQEITNNPNQACTQYMTGCHACDFDPSFDCYDWTEGLNELHEAFSNQSWISTAKTSQYYLTQVSYKTDAYVERMEVRVHLFGKDYNFTVEGEDINVHDIKHTGEVIAKHAVEKARQRGLQHMNSN